MLQGRNMPSANPSGLNHLGYPARKFLERARITVIRCLQVGMNRGCATDEGDYG